MAQLFRYKIQETLFRVDFQIYNNITLAMSYFVDKHEILRLYKYTNYNKYHKDVRIMKTPIHPTFIKLNWALQGYILFSYFCSITLL